MAKGKTVAAVKAVEAKARAYSYVRFSTPEQAKGDSLRRQTALAEDYARAHGLELDTELTLNDLGVSAFRGANMEAGGALGAFLSAAQTGVVPPGSYLLVESLDRVSRKTAARAANVLQSICYAGVRVVTLADGRVYDEQSLDDDPVAFIMAVLVFMRAHEESLTKSRRLSASWSAKRARAHEVTVTGRMPAWLKLSEDRKPVLDEDRVKVVKRIVKDYLKGHGVESIARRLNDDQVEPFGKADHWRRSSVYKILTSPALVGVAVFSAADPADATKMIVQRTLTDYYPPAIGKDDYERIRERIGKSGSGGRQHKGVLHNILSGLARCPICGGTMTRISKGSIPKKSGKPYLVCAKAKVGRCEYIGVHLEVVESLLLYRYAEILAAMPAADATVERDLLDKQASVDALEERMEELLRILEQAPSDSLGKRVQALDVDLKTAQGELQELQDKASASEGKLVRIRVDAAQVAFRARPLDRSRINGCLRELLESVTVNHTTGYLIFKWRHRGESSVLYSMPSAA